VDPTKLYGDGIYAVDSGYQADHFDAIHLIVENGRAAIIDTAVNASIPHLLSEMSHLGIAVGDVDFVILTHVHLDHAGGAGQLMAALPAAKLVVHPRGARHMIDPTKLMSATYDVYGRAEAEQMYGDVLPIPAERVIEATHESTVDLAGRVLQMFDSPGHAKHHICIRDSRTGHIFTGDTFGLSYRELDANGRQFVYPSSSPSQFDPAALHSTVDMIAAFKPAAVYVTHYSQITDVPRLAGDMHRLIDAQLDVAQKVHASLPAEVRHEQIKSGLRQLVETEAATQGWGLQGKAASDFFAMDIDLNAQGIEIWLDSQQQKT